MDDVSIAGTTLPASPEERGAPESPRRKRERRRPAPAAAGTPPVETEPAARECELDVVV